MSVPSTQAGLWLWLRGDDRGTLLHRSTTSPTSKPCHMLGHDDGITDALFRFSRPLTGSYFHCPALRDDGTLDLPIR